MFLYQDAAVAEVEVNAEALRLHAEKEQNVRERQYIVAVTGFQAVFRGYQAKRKVNILRETKKKADVQKYHRHLYWHQHQYQHSENVEHLKDKCLAFSI